MIVSTQTATETYAARLRSRGQVTIPQAVRESLSLNQGDFLTVVQLGDAVLLTPKISRQATQLVVL